jgi:site-specific recombinase XerD
LKTESDLSEIDLLHGRSTHVTRSMLVSLALRSGLRVSEICNLKVKDVHLIGKDNYLHVSKAKGGKKRDVYIAVNLVKQLKQYLEIKKRSWSMSDRSGNVFLFTWQGRAKIYYDSNVLVVSKSNQTGWPAETLSHSLGSAFIRNSPVSQLWQFKSGAIVSRP